MNSIRLPHLFYKENNLIVLGEIIALGIISSMSLSFFSTKDAFDVILSLAFAYLLPRLIYSKIRLNCSFGQWLLLFVGTTLAIYTIISIKSWTVDVGGSFEYPDLKSDDAGYYRWALAHFDGRCPEPKVGFKGLSLFMLCLWKVLGVSVVWPIALNYYFIMLSIVMTGILSDRLLHDRLDMMNIKNISVIAMLMVSLLGFLLSQ